MYSLGLQKLRGLSIQLFTIFGVLRLISCSDHTTDDTDAIKWTPGPTWAPKTAKQIEETLKKTKIIPDALDKAPEHNANIMWYDLPMGFGRTLVPFQVEYFPTWFQWPHDVNKLYTFVMTDLDYPTKKDPSGREFVIWLIGNIAGSEGLAGKQLTEYRGWQSSLHTDPDLHRYLVTIYEQPEKEPIDFQEDHLESQKAIQNRTRFSTRKFASKYKLGNPIAVDFAFVNVSGPTD